MQQFTIMDAEAADKQHPELDKLTRNEKLLLIVAAVLFLALIVTSTILLCSGALKTSPVTPDNAGELNSVPVEVHPIKVCQTEECQRAASSFLLTMDREVKPCEDFYSFACGKWKPEKGAGDQIRKLRRNILEELVELTENIGEDDLIPLQQMKVLYLSCLNLKPGDIETQLPVYSHGYDVDRRKRYSLADLHLDVGASTSVRRLECVDRLEKVLMPFALTHKYFLEKMNNGTVDDARELSTLVKQSFKSFISRLDWMDRFTKGLVAEMVHDMEISLGYPDWLRKPEAINDCYQGLEFGNGTLRDNLVILKNWEVETKKSRNPECMRKQIWGIGGVSPAEVAPKFVEDRILNANFVVIPGGILQQPFMGMGLSAADFGALGMLIGHELQHAFDDWNSDKPLWNDTKISSWSESVLETFRNRTRCFANHHRNYWFSLHGATSAVENYRANTYPTLNEVVADNVGLQVAYEAYKLHLAESGMTEEPRLPGLEDYTPEQVFFLSFAHAHCSNGNTPTVFSEYHSSADEYQVFGALSNSHEFSKAWKCSKTSRMNPEHKCIV